MRQPPPDARSPGFLAHATKPAVEPASFPGGPPRPATTTSSSHLRAVPTPTPAPVETPPPPPAPVVAAPAPPSPAVVRAAVEEKMAGEISARLAAAVELLRATSERVASDARTDALELGFLIAKRILEREISSGVEPLVALVRSAVRRLGDARKIVVRMNPQDAEAVHTVLSSRGAASLVGHGLAQIDVVPDPGLSRGDCMVDGDLGSVDGRLSTRLEELRRTLEGALLGEEEGGA